LPYSWIGNNKDFTACTSSRRAFARRILSVSLIESPEPHPQKAGVSAHGTMSLPLNSWLLSIVDGLLA
jgi:hypothetical protein